jgi:hypothetical protein
VNFSLFLCLPLQEEKSNAVTVHKRVLMGLLCSAFTTSAITLVAAQLATEFVATRAASLSELQTSPPQIWQSQPLF